jgi:hypothetical protein
MRNCLIALLMLPLAACNRNTATTPPIADSSLLPAHLVRNPRTAGGLDERTAANMPILQFEDTVIDFGQIVAGRQVEREFSFRNEGQTPLVISDIRTSCGCTVAEFPQEPSCPASAAR